ncbi:MAG: beta tubulin [Rhizobium sp. 63-7]|nr:MAG: beta tubulin [Rhizobium sp. 63-7]
MRTIPAGLKAHLDGGATTVCHAWRVTRRDGTVLGFTEHDHDLVFGGTLFAAATGFAASETQQAAGLSVEASDVAGGFSSAAIREEDLIDGRYDGARVEVFLVNWAAVDEHMLLRVQEIGEVTRTAGDFRAELRSFTHRLGRDQGRLFGRRCDATLGDGRCGVNLASGAYRGTGDILSVADATHLRVGGLSGFAAGFFRYGVLTFTSGRHVGMSVDIDGHVVDGAAVDLVLWLPMARLPEVGDAFAIVAGCDKAFSTCRAKFSNTINFRGFPHIPGSDFAYSYADGETVHDGRALFE